MRPKAGWSCAARAASGAARVTTQRGGPEVSDLTWLAECGTTLSDANQTDIDDWLACAPALLRCRVVGTVGRGVHSSDGEDKFGEGVRDPMPRVDVKAEFVVAAVEVLDEGVSRADDSR